MKKTVIVIAHRLSTISLSQRVIVLEHGKVVQDGSFAELANMEGSFRKMWIHQNVQFSDRGNI